MAKLYITEYSNSVGSVGKETAVTTQSPISFSGSSSQSSAFNAKTRMIRVHTDAICSIEVGKNPTATTSSKRMAANDTEYFFVNPADKLAVITNT